MRAGKADHTKKIERRFAKHPNVLKDPPLKTSLRTALLGAGLAYLCALVAPFVFAILNIQTESPALFTEFALVELFFAAGFFVFVRYRMHASAKREFYLTCAATGAVISVLLIPFYYTIVNSFAQ